MINLKYVDEQYQNYKKLSEKQNEINEEIKTLLKEHGQELDYLLMIDFCIRNNPEYNKKYLEKYGNTLIWEFESKNELLRKYNELLSVRKSCESEMEKLINCRINHYQRFIALKHDYDENYDLLELYTQEKIDLGQFSKDKIDFIIESLRFACSFICFATREDLPLLMNILEDYDSFDRDSYEEPEERYLVESSLCSDMEREFLSAKMFDSKKEQNDEAEHKIWCVSEKEIERLLINLESNKYKMTEKEYKEQYYYILMLRDNIEEVYLNASDDDKKIVLNAYIKLSNGPERRALPPYNYQYRTASSLINQEVLKRRFIERN